MTSFMPAKTGLSRVFLIDGRARPDHQPVYQSSMKAGSLSQSFGDVEKIEIPSSSAFNQFVEIGTIRGSIERVTVTLTGRYALDLKSEILKLARRGCSIDVHVNFGSCENPSGHNEFSKKVVLEDAILTSYDTEDLGALGSDERAKIDESVDVSARDVYELVQISWAERAGDVVTNEVLDNLICDDPSCGTCTDESDGCEKMFAITTNAGGSPSTPADVVFSLDEGATFLAHDIDTMGASDVPDEVDCIGLYLVVVSEDTTSMHIALLSEFTATDDPAFTEVTTGFVAGGGPRAISSNPDRTMAFIVGAEGFIYSTTDPNTSVTVLDAGVAFPLGTYNAVDTLSSEFAVAVGNAGIMAITQNGTTWTAITTIPWGVGIDLNTVAVKSTSVWFVGTSDGRLWYTLDTGVTWTEKGFNLSGTGVVTHVEIANETVMYMAHQTAGTLGRILRSTNGGFDWVIMPSGSGSLPVNDRINAVAACAHNPDTVFGVGLADDAADGFIIVGTE